MRFLIIFLLLSGICLAEEFQVNKNIDAGGLVEEIELSTGLTLRGQNQIGYMNTSLNKIEIKLKDRELTQDEKDKIKLAINSHDSEKIKQMQKAERKQKEEAVKQKLGLSDKDFQNLKDALED